MNNNHLFTLSYFRKRLFDEDILTKVLIKNYSREDSRYWTISIHPERQIFCTCFRDGERFWFEFSDGKNLLKNSLRIETLSMKVITKSITEWITE